MSKKKCRKKKYKEPKTYKFVCLKCKRLSNKKGKLCKAKKVKFSFSELRICPDI